MVKNREYLEGGNLNERITEAHCIVSDLSSVDIGKG